MAFPNPEEPGAMDQAMALAPRVDADIVVANDPDADRCAVAVPGPHGWQMLRGDEVGALLAQHLLGRGKHGVYAQSIVSSSLLGAMAAAAGEEHQETLTGFKWIGRIPGLAFGYEEALGYCVDPEHVKDKDGVSALLLVCELAAAAKAAGRRCGTCSTTSPASTACTPPTSSASGSPTWPRSRQRCSGCASSRRQPRRADGAPARRPRSRLRGPAADRRPAVRLADRARVIVRPSGTEPKVKCYLEVVIPVEPEDGVDAARIAAVGRLDASAPGSSRQPGL